MIILSEKQKKSETNIHLNIKVINKGPSEHFFLGVKTFWFVQRPCCFCQVTSPRLCSTQPVC